MLQRDINTAEIKFVQRYANKARKNKSVEQVVFTMEQALLLMFMTLIAKDIGMEK